MPPLPSAEKSDSSDSGPNLLGGAYDSSGDEEEDDDRGPVAKASTATAARWTIVNSSASPGERSGSSSRPTLPLVVGASGRKEEGAGGVVAERPKVGVHASAVPDAAKRVVVDKMVGFVARNGSAFEDRVRER